MLPKKLLWYKLLPALWLACRRASLPLPFQDIRVLPPWRLVACSTFLQGFRIVFSLVEIMSRHTVAGSADLLEDMLFSGWIAYNLRFGQCMMAVILQNADETKFEQCQNGVDEWW